MHRNHVIIEASSGREMGRKMGRHFAVLAHQAVEWARADAPALWRTLAPVARRCLEESERTAPHLIEEMRGYAEGAGLHFDDYWLLNLEDEFAETERCTTIVTNQGGLVGHSEDWDPAIAHHVFVLERRLAGLTTFELYYANTPGGNALSINSWGLCQAINSLPHRRVRAGVPRNIVARWLSDSAGDRATLAQLAGWRRCSGYSHTLVDRDGDTTCIESTATAIVTDRVDLPFVHTNHILSRLLSAGQPAIGSARGPGQQGEAEFVSDRAARSDAHDTESSLGRYRAAVDQVRPTMTVQDMQTLLDNRAGQPIGVRNPDTVASIVIDRPGRRALVWLAQEPSAGWVAYDLNFLQPAPRHQGW
ncbi:MAG: C45 family peptidase [Proteobacteria bacterium]|nr:C45 family peptidase [Pseudomonadota bacterium]